MSPTKMTAEQIKAAIRRMTDEGNKGNLEAMIDEYYSPNYVSHNLNVGTDIKGPAAEKQTQREQKAQFPDRHTTIEDIIVEGNKAFIRRTWTGTHKGKLGATAGNLAPTGKKVTMTQFVVYRFAGSKLAESWFTANRLSFYQQLGVTPTANMK